ncbi:hypothetical protein Esti_002268 [Eimeria stiedai]
MTASVTAAALRDSGRSLGRRCSSSAALVGARSCPSVKQHFNRYDRNCSQKMMPAGREARAVPWEPREQLLEARKEPRYMAECRGTPRMEYPENLIDGVRVRPTFNPYVKLTRSKRYKLDNWPSRNWADWNPYSCFVRGSRRRYQIPKDLMPYKDELGEWHPPRLSGRYKADVERQFRLNGLAWVWRKDFYREKQHFQDREPLGPKRWYIREFRQQQVKEAMRKMRCETGSITTGLKRWCTILRENSCRPNTLENARSPKFDLMRDTWHGCSPAQYKQHVLPSSPARAEAFVRSTLQFQLQFTFAGAYDVAARDACVRVNTRENRLKRNGKCASSAFDEVVENLSAYWQKAEIKPGMPENVFLSQKPLADACEEHLTTKKLNKLLRSTLDQEPQRILAYRAATPLQEQWEKRKEQHPQLQKQQEQLDRLI